LTFFGWGWPFSLGLNLLERRHQAMSAEPLPKLLAKWQQGDLTVEQAIGQILQHLAAIYKLFDDLKQQLLKLLPKDKK
jgi:hypothetical protein